MAALRAVPWWAWLVLALILLGGVVGLGLWLGRPDVAAGAAGVAPVVAAAAVEVSRRRAAAARAQAEEQAAVLEAEADRLEGEAAAHRAQAEEASWGNSRSASAWLRGER